MSTTRFETEGGPEILLIKSTYFTYPTNKTTQKRQEAEMENSEDLLYLEQMVFTDSITGGSSTKDGGQKNRSLCTVAGTHTK